MRTDVTESIEDFERLAEDYFDLIPPDPDSFELELCTKWEFDEWERTFKFYFDKEWDLDTFLDKLMDCPKMNETIALNDMHEGVNRANLTIIVEGRIGGLIS